MAFSPGLKNTQIVTNSFSFILHRGIHLHTQVSLCISAAAPPALVESVPGHISSIALCKHLWQGWPWKPKAMNAQSFQQFWSLLDIEAAYLMKLELCCTWGNLGYSRSSKDLLALREERGLELYSQVQCLQRVSTWSSPALFRENIATL